MKEHNSPSIICALLLLGAVLVSPAFAEMEKVDEAELAQTNASITGASVQNWIAGADNGAIRPDMVQPTGTMEEKGVAYSPVATKAMEGITLHLDQIGQEVFTFNFSGARSSTYGSITRVETRK